MSHEQAFEQQGEEGLAPSHRQWEEAEPVELDLAMMYEQHIVMTGVNQRLSEHRSRPLGRTMGDAAAWSVSALLLLILLNTGSDNTVAIPPMLIAIWLYQRSLHQLDTARAALTLQEYDKRWIGPLFDALSWPNRRINRIVRLKLINLLPMITESDAKWLSAKHRIAILSVLEGSADTDLKLAILKAIPRFGDMAAVGAVERLSKARVWTLDTYRVRRAALVCLPLLREHARKSAVVVSSSDMLDMSVPVTAITRPAEIDLFEKASAPKRPIADVQENSARARLEAEREKVARPAMRVAFLIANYSIIVPFSVFQTVTSFAHHAPLTGLAWAACATGATQLYRISLSSKRVAMMRKQAQQRDIKAVGLLAEALSWPEIDLQYEAASALIVILPLLKANHSALLSAQQRECLHRLLTLSNAREQSDLIVAILQAFQQVGDTAAIPYVEQLANATPRSAQERKVVAEAQECLPYLKLCAGNNAASHSLLRPSSMTDLAAEDNLLRAVRENPETRSEQLLRPGDFNSQ